MILVLINYLFVVYLFIIFLYIFIINVNYVLHVHRHYDIWYVT